VRRLPRVLLILLVLAALGVLMLTPYARSAAFIMDLGGVTHWSRRLLPGAAAGVTWRDVTIPTRHGGLAARIYTPAPDAQPAPGFIIFPGIHRGGVDEPRLSGFSRRFASAGVTVVSVPLPDLREFRVTARTTDQIEDATMWAASDASIGRNGRIGLGGVSFAGGLTLVAAGRPSLRDRLSMVVSFGGYGDLSRVLRFLCTGVLPDGTHKQPHDYGVAVVLLEVAPAMVPADQVEPLRRGVLTFLEGSLHDVTDKPRAAALFAGARAQAAALPEPARTLLTWVNDRDVARLGPALLPHVEQLAGSASLSPERSPAPLAPVFLLHGRDDNVIPSAETPLTAAYLRARGNTRVKTLLTPLVSHADLNTNAPLGDAWQLVKFWKAMMDVK
jgi:acetyl esterase/lipase